MAAASGVMVSSANLAVRPGVRHAANGSGIVSTFGVMPAPGLNVKPVIVACVRVVSPSVVTARSTTARLGMARATARVAITISYLTLMVSADSRCYATRITSRSLPGRRVSGPSVAGRSEHAGAAGQAVHVNDGNCSVSCVVRFTACGDNGFALDVMLF